MEFSSILLALGFLLIFHSGFSAAHFKWLVGKNVSDELPVDIYFEVAMGFIIAMAGSIFAAGQFKHIRTSNAMLSRGQSCDFHVFNHRGVRKAAQKISQEKLDID